MRFGERLWVCPGDRDPPEPDAVNILLDPGLAFGTGTHATTALCLEWLDANPPAGQAIIDYGCGSGILAIAALKLGAQQAWTVDIDPQALLACTQNAQRNQVAGSMTPITPEQLPDTRVDLIMANILAGPLMTLAPRFAALIHRGGRLILSGILLHQAAEVSAAYADHFDFAPLRRRQGWVLLTATRR
jgi:ribosomal protein L11 methyltransferase